MKTDNFITIYGWMLQTLGLNGNALLVYATVYTYTDHCARPLTASEIGEWSGTGKSSTYRILSVLANRTLIGIEQRDGTTYYRAYPRPLQTNLPLLSQNETTQSQNETTQSQNETTQSQNETTQSQNETTQSQNETTQSQNETVINNINNSNSSAAQARIREAGMAENFSRDRPAAGAAEGFPSAREVQAYATEQHIDSSLADAWFRQMTAAGWHLPRGDRVKNWRRCLDYYLRNGLIRKPAAQRAPFPVKGQGPEIGSAAPCNTPGVVLLPHQIEEERRREADWQRYLQEKGTPELDATIAEVCARWGVK